MCLVWVVEGGSDYRGGGGCLELNDTGLLIQETDSDGMMLEDYYNGFNELSQMAMLWMVRHRWLEGARFAFNYYKHWVQIFLRRPRIPPGTILSQERLTQGDPLLMVLYRINLVTLSEEFWAEEPGLLAPFYTYDAAFYGSD